MLSNRSILLTTSLLISMNLSACATTQPALDAHSSTFGQATAQNIAAQRVEPTPEQKANTFISPNLARQKAARQAYEAGETAEPVAPATSN